MKTEEGFYRDYIAYCTTVGVVTRLSFEAWKKFSHYKIRTERGTNTQEAPFGGSSIARETHNRETSKKRRKK